MYRKFILCLSKCYVAPVCTCVAPVLHICGTCNLQSALKSAARSCNLQFAAFRVCLRLLRSFKTSEVKITDLIYWLKTGMTKQVSAASTANTCTPVLSHYLWRFTLGPEKIVFLLGCTACLLLLTGACTG